MLWPTFYFSGKSLSLYGEYFLYTYAHTYLDVSIFKRFVFTVNLFIQRNVDIFTKLRKWRKLYKQNNTSPQFLSWRRNQKNWRIIRETQGHLMLFTLFIGAPTLFIGAPTLFIEDPTFYIWEPKRFIGAPRFVI